LSSRNGFGEESISSPALESESILGFEAWEMSHRNNEIDKHKHYHSEDERLLTQTQSRLIETIKSEHERTILKDNLNIFETKCQI
jgi:hypothetical protein